MTSFKPLPEQEAVIDFVASGSGSLDVEALAGAGKSTTLRLAAPNAKGRCLALAFNVKIKDALVQQLPDRFAIKTFNGLGMRAFSKFLQGRTKLTVNGNKIFPIVRRNLEAAGWTKGATGYDDLRELVMQAVGMARTHGLVPNGIQAPVSKAFYKDTEEDWMALADLADADINADNFGLVIPLAREILKECITSSFNGNIDFADQIYMACCFSGQFDRFDTVFVDEVQDVSPLNIYMITKSIASGGRLIAVGDKNQGIYAFRGADANAIPFLREKFKTTTLPLTTTFRCAKNIVNNLHWHAPAMRPADWAPEGSVQTKDEGWSVTSLKPGAAVLCRNNAPLIALAFRMLRNGIPPNVIGGEMNKQINGAIIRLCNGDPDISETVLMDRLDKWEAKEIAEAKARDQLLRIDRIVDKADCIRNLPGKTAKEMVANVTKLFDNTDGIIDLSTGHKSKGLEWDTVYHLDNHLIGARRELSESQKGQEANLRYVIDSRAKTEHVYLSSKQMEAA